MELRTFDFDIADCDKWRRLSDYYYLYILENGREAYVGQTKRIAPRSREHTQERDLCSAYAFRHIHIITDPDFEETPAKHYETLLIRLMRADGLFHILNDRKQWQRYGRQNDFELRFDELWLQLEQAGLVRHKTFQEVCNLSAYKYSPRMPLTDHQQETLTSIVHTIDSQETSPHESDCLARPILITGDAGTGKTVVATSLFHYLRTHDRYRGLKIGLVYAVSATRAEIQEVFKGVPGLYKRDVVAPIAVAKQRYDIVICDEAQRLRRAQNAGRYYSGILQAQNRRMGLPEDSDELDWLLRNSRWLVLFYDDKQSVCPADIPTDSFMHRLYAVERGVRPVALQEQMRLRAGADYGPYIRAVLSGQQPRPQVFPGYELRLYSSFDAMLRRLRACEQEYGLCRLCAGYAWPWTARDDPSGPDILLGSGGVWWNGQTSGWLHNTAAREEMGSIYTLPGLDLNYTAVVIGPELRYDTASGRITVDRQSFCDNRVKRGVNDEALLRYILNTYAVFMTRGIRGTWLYVCDAALRDHLARYIPFASDDG